MNRRSDPRPRKQPRYLRHGRWDTALCYVRDADGRRVQIHLGKYDSPESWQKFHELAAKVAMGETVIEPSTVSERASPDGTLGTESNITIEKLVSKFLRHAEDYYRKPDGRPTREHPNFALAVRPLLKLYRDELAKDFGPLKLQEVREAMVLGTFAKKGKGWCRNYINKQVRRIKLMFEWAVSQELIKAEVLDQLKSVKGLKKGRTTARETHGKPPVSPAAVVATLPFLARQVAGMVQAQRLIGCRPDEIVHMRTGDLDRSGEVWLYRPSSHKVEHHDREVAYPVGPRCQEILKGFLKADPKAYLFDPREAEAERRAEQRKARKSKVPPSQIERARRVRENPQRIINPCYSVRTYEKAIERACVKARIEIWCPIQLRKARATEVRKDYGLEGSQVVLNHANANVTQLYADRDLALAMRIAAETG